MEQLYRHEYYSETKPLYFERMREDSPWWQLAYGDRYDTFESFLPPDRRRILDVGSGPGLFLQHGKDRGWETTGIEPSQQAADHSRGLGLAIVEDFLSEESAGPLGCFDVVHMSEVLEHIGDPASLLQTAHGMLKPDGILCVGVPNDYNPFQDALRKAAGFPSWWVAPPHHVNYFDFESMAALFARVGFDVVAQEGTFPLELFLLMGDNYVGDDELGRICHGRRKTMEFNLAAAGMSSVKRDLYRSLASVGLGREVCMYGRRAS
jgi:SAM-dependent methyltransferase